MLDDTLKELRETISDFQVFLNKYTNIKVHTANPEITPVAIVLKPKQHNFKAYMAYLDSLWKESLPGIERWRKNNHSWIMFFNDFSSMNSHYHESNL